MWSHLPKKCSTPIPTNEGSACNTGIPACNYIYNGIDLSCLGVLSDTELTQVIQQIDLTLCSVQFTQQLLDNIQASPEDYTELITLINNVVDCNVILACNTVYTYNLTVEYSTKELACSAPDFLRYTVYSNSTIQSGTILYTDEALTTVFEGTNDWYKVIGTTTVFQLGVDIVTTDICLT